MTTALDKAFAAADAVGVEESQIERAFRAADAMTPAAGPGTMLGAGAMGHIPQSRVDINKRYMPSGETILKLHQETGLSLAEVSDALGMANSELTATGPGYGKIVDREILRRKYQGVFDELTMGAIGGTYDVESAAKGTTAGIGKFLARSPLFYPLTRYGPLKEQAVDLDKLSADLDKKAQALYEEARSPLYQLGEGAGFAGYVTNTTGRVMPMMLSSVGAAAVTGPGGAFMVGAMIEGDNAYRDALANGATEEEANMARLVVGTINGVIEMAQVSQILKLGKGAKNPLLKEFADAIREKSMKKIAMTTGKLTAKHVEMAINEGFEEVAQEWVGEGAAVAIYSKDFDINDLLNRTGRAFAGGATAGWMLGAGSIVLQSAIEATEEAPVEQIPVRPAQPPMAMTEDEYAQYETTLPEPVEAAPPPAAAVPAEAPAAVAPEAVPVEGKQPWEGTVYRAGDLKSKVSVPPDLRGIYFAEDKDLAQAYTELEGAQAKSVQEYRVRLENPATDKIVNQIAEELDIPVDDGAPVFSTDFDATMLTDELQARGYDGVVRDTGEIVTFEDTAIRPTKTPKAPPAEGKQPWEMTREEFTNGNYNRAEMDAFIERETKRYTTMSPTMARRNVMLKPLWQLHRSVIKDAVEQSKPVPRAVLQEYAGQPWADKALAQQTTPESLRPATTAQTELAGQEAPAGKEAQDAIDKQKAEALYADVVQPGGPGTIAGEGRQTGAGEGGQRVRPGGQEEITQAEPTWGAKNTGVTRSEYEAILDKQRKTGKLKGGREAGGTILFSPEEWSDLVRVGRFHAEAGARAFADWSQRMIKDFGTTIEPYIEKIWADVQRPIDSDEVGKRKFIESLQNAGILDEGETAEYQVRNTGVLASKAAALVLDDLDTAERVARNQTDDAGVATAVELLKHYHREAEAATSESVKTAMYEKISDLAHKAATNLTEAGRTVQAASILGMETPEGVLRFAAREINKYNETHKRKLPHLTAEQIKSIEDEMKAIQAMPDGIEKAKRFHDLMDRIRALTPTSLMDKIITLWKAGLLTGIKTSGLNTLSNAWHGVSEVVKDVPAVGMDMLQSVFTGKRSVAFAWGGSYKGFMDGVKKGWTYFRTGFSERNVADKWDWKHTNYGDSLLGKAAQVYTDTVFRALGAEDQPFYYGAKARSLTNQAIAIAKNEGLTGGERDIRIKELLANPTDEMMKYALLDAETAVFQNRTKLGDIARNMQKVKGVEFIIPFSRTPSAIAMQIINYSPVGAVKAIIQNIGNYDQRIFSQEIARAVTGTGVMYLGAELFRAGLMSLDRPDTERERELWKLEGRGANSIKIGDKWRSAQVLGPVGIVMVIGGHFAKSYDDTGSPTKAIVTAMSGGAKSFTEQTFLRGLNTTIDAITNPERSFEFFFSSLAGSVVPTLVSDIARASDSVERRTSGPVDRVQSRIPGLRQRLEPTVNVFGQDLPRYGGNVIEVMVDPTRPVKINADVVVDEIRRLWDAGQRRAAPTLLGDKDGYAGLTLEQNTQLWRRAGELTYYHLYNAIHNPYYQRADDEAKAKALDRVVDNAKTQARIEIAYMVLQGIPESQRPQRIEELRDGGLITNEIERGLGNLL